MTDAAIPVWWRGNNNQWSSGGEFPRGARLDPFPLAAVANSPDDIHVFAVDRNTMIWWWHWNGSSWNIAEQIPGRNGVPNQRIAAVSAAPGRLDVFAVGSDAHLWHCLKESNKPWVLKVRGGNLPSEGVSAVSWGLNRIDVFAASREPGNPLQHWWANGDRFEGPETQPFMGANLASGTVSAVSSAPNKLDVFGITHDNHLAHWAWDGSRWSGPSLRGEGIPAGDVSAVVRQTHRLDVFVTGAGNTLRKWPGGGLENGTQQPWVNWPTNHKVDPVSGHLQPDSLEELVNIVREAEQLGRGVRAVGSSWSNSDVAVTPAYVVETDKLNGILTHVLSTSLNDLGSTLRLVHVEAGIIVDDLNTLLDNMDQRGLALKTMGGSSGQSLAGVVSTSTHGMDIDRGPIPDMVRAIHLVGPGGVQHWIEPSVGITNNKILKSVLGLADEDIHYDDDLFNSVLVSMGSMGIIYSLVVEVDPQYDLIERRERVDWSVMKDRLKGSAQPDPFTGNRGVQVVINPYPLKDGTRPCYLTTRTEDAPTTAYADPKGVSFILSTAARLALANMDRDLVDDVLPGWVSETQPLRTGRGLGHTVMAMRDPGPAKGLTVEVAFDATNTRYLDFVDAALEILKTAYYVEPQRLAYLGWISMRFQGRSRAYLSPQHASNRTCTIEFASFWRLTDPGPTWADTPILLDRIETKAREFGGIQHWGLNNLLNANDVSRAYPRLDTWRRVRWELSRGGTISTFDSDFTRRCGLSAPPFIVRNANYPAAGRTDAAVWRPGTGVWMIYSVTGEEKVEQWGQVGDIPVPGDYDGDGRANFAVWRPSTGTWFVIEPVNGTDTIITGRVLPTVPTRGNRIESRRERTQQWGLPGDIPVPADYSGDNRTDFAVWRPSTGVWWIKDNVTGAERSQQWGLPGDIPVPADYSGDNRTDFAVWRPSTGVWWIKDNVTGAERSQQWGLPGDIPVPADYSGDGRIDFAVWRPSTGVWWIKDNVSGAERSQQWGDSRDIPVPRDYSGDGRVDFAVWRPSTGVWWIKDNVTGAERNLAYGKFGDVPV
ncbi:MAG: FAD-binding protein [Anaerolineae bacterium]|nr:FAD-binding protein [Anaerolineae bacterium]